MSERRDTMTDAEISILALEIIKDFQSLSTKTNIDPDDSFLSKLDTDSDIDDIISDLETSNPNYPLNKYGIIPLESTDSLYDIPPLPDHQNPLSPKFKPSNLSIHIPQIHYHHSGNKKRATKIKKLKTNQINESHKINPMDPSLSRSFSPKSNLSQSIISPSNISITGYSPYNSTIYTHSTSLSISPNRSPVYSPQKFNVPPIDIDLNNNSLAVNSNEKYKNKNGKRSHKFMPNTVNNIPQSIDVSISDEYINNNSLSVISKEYKCQNKKCNKKVKKRKHKIRYNKTPVPRVKKKKNIKFKRDRKYKSDELQRIGKKYYEQSTKSLMNEFSVNIKKKMKNKYAKNNIFENRSNISNESIESDMISHKYIGTVSIESESPKQPLPFFVKRGAVVRHLNYGRSVPGNIENNNKIIKAKEITYLYNSQSNKYGEKKKKKHRRKHKKKRRKKERKLHVQNEIRSATPVPKSMNNIKRNKKSKHRSNSIVNIRNNKKNKNNNNEYMIEFEDGFIFVNNNKL